MQDHYMDIWIMTRTTISDDWSIPVPLGPTVNSSAEESWPSISHDGLSLYFCDGFSRLKFRPEGYGEGDIWVTRRTSDSDPWNLPENLGPIVNTKYSEVCPFIWGDGCTLLFSSIRPGGRGSWDLWIATRGTKSDNWDKTAPLENVNSSIPELGPAVSPDGLILLFQRGHANTSVLWMATRRTVDEPFGLPEKVATPVNSPYYEDCSARFSADGSTLYFGSTRPGGCGDYDLWQVPILRLLTEPNNNVDLVEKLVENYYGKEVMPWRNE